MSRLKLLVTVYDKLAEFIFKGEVKSATIAFLGRIDKGDNVLIVGGGTGWILEYLPLDVRRVTYVDVSKEMISEATKHDVPFPVEFITGSYSAIPENQYYEVIITPFFLDMFCDEELEGVMRHISGYLKEKGIWLFTDFVHPKKLRHRILIVILYFFFSLFYRIKKYNLPDYDQCFNKYRMKLVKKKDSGDGLFTSRVYTITDNREM